MRVLPVILVLCLLGGCATVSEMTPKHREAAKHAERCGT
jgi:hypothetical protein